jgi:acetylornithine deacetylase/succinyl-diaminopimelate desuccinylase-like protein
MQAVKDTEVPKKFLEVPLDNPDPIFEYFLDLSNREIVFRGERPNRFLYVRGQRENKILLVAHADTVWDGFWRKPKDLKHELIFSNGVFQSSGSVYGIGADDRAGCAMLWLLKDLGHSLLITDGEEAGGLGSNWLMQGCFIRI